MARRTRAQGTAPTQVLGERWENGMHELFLGLREWRATHPHATLAEIERELDRRMARVRAQIMTDLALASTAADLLSGDPPACPECGGVLHDTGRQARTLVTLGNEPVTLERDYATCAQCGRRLFPLDTELALLPNHRFTPRVEEVAARVGATVPFAEAARLLQGVLGCR